MLDNYDIYISSLLAHGVSVAEINKIKDVLNASKELVKVLESPTVPLDEKKKVIDEIFTSNQKDFVISLCANDDLQNLNRVIDAYQREIDCRNRVSTAIVYCVNEPSEDQIQKIKQFVMKEENSSDANIRVIKDPSLIGGFIIQVGDKEFDHSIRTKLAEIKEEVKDSAKKATDNDKIISLLKEKISSFEFDTDSEEIGTVMTVSDGIATIRGIEHAMYGEVVIFEDGSKGMVQDIKKNHIGVILFENNTEICQGGKVKRSHKKAGIPVGEKFIGRIVNSLGDPIDGKGPIESSDYRAVEQTAPSIVDRKSVDTPMATGILSIDSMFPIGRGQRELIIGDRQTGKTSIAIDTILNQKGKDVICIYNAIGQKASSVAKIVSSLTKAGAMAYTIVVCSTASDSASLQYISPYSATALAEYFMYQGKDCLIVYDDLSKHAVAYRALSLLLERSPGREAYPGDVFYLHSRLLERSSKLTVELGGGSITALPIIETQAGDVSAYIPTNVISITDGQIFLESDLFFSGMRPAVNVGLSVSRVGGAAQTKAMKKAAGSLRIDLAQYREMEVFTQFSSDLDEETKAGLVYGKGLMELLKQPLGRPLSLSEMVISLVGATNKKYVDVPVEKIKPFQMEMLSYIEDNKSSIISTIEDRKVLDDDLKQEILSAIDEFKKVYNG